MRQLSRRPLCHSYKERMSSQVLLPMFFALYVAYLQYRSIFDLRKKKVESLEREMENSSSCSHDIFEKIFFRALSFSSRTTFLLRLIKIFRLICEFSTSKYVRPKQLFRPDESPPLGGRAFYYTFRDIRLTSLWRTALCHYVALFSALNATLFRQR